MVVPHDGDWARVVFSGALTPVCRGAAKEHRDESLLPLSTGAFALSAASAAKTVRQLVPTAKGNYFFVGEF